MKEFIKGVGNNQGIVSGETIKWTKSLIKEPYKIRNKIILFYGNPELVEIAFAGKSEPKGIIIQYGGKNYHPLIYLTDNCIPTVVAIGNKIENIKEYSRYTLNSNDGKIGPYQGINVYPKYSEINSKNLYTNLSLLNGLEPLKKINVLGIGLLRTEFLAVQFLAEILLDNFQLDKSKTILDKINEANEADVLYELIKIDYYFDKIVDKIATALNKVVEVLGIEKIIIVRTLDIPRDSSDQMGNRGIRRCISEGGKPINVILKAIKKSIKETNGKFGLILPLVSHYSQIDETFSLIKKQNLDRVIKFGWEIEQPAGSISCDIWIESFISDNNNKPDYIGIGTNDLTQFTLALGRDTSANEPSESKKYITSLYSELEPSVIIQLLMAYKACKFHNVNLFLLGQIASNKNFAWLMYSLDVKLSVPSNKIELLESYMDEFKKFPKDFGVKNYIDFVKDNNGSSISKSLENKIKSIIG